MKLTQITPTKMLIQAPDEVIVSLQKTLTFIDKSVQFELAKMKKNQWFALKHGQDLWREKIDELKEKMQKCLLFQERSGMYWTYPGLTETLLKCFPEFTVERTFSYPEYNEFISFEKAPLEPYEYQKQIIASLIKANHAGVEVGTGLGKSLVILYLVGRIGLKTVVMAPSKDIALRLYQDLSDALGDRLVGFLGDGKRKTHKLVTVGISASLTKLKKGTKEWTDLSQAQVFIADESHQCPAATLEHVCHGVLKDAPYRFFFSATQMRNDGRDLLLEAITGPIVYTKSVLEGIQEGYLSKLHFFIVKTNSGSTYVARDPNDSTREHLYYNENVLKAAATIANKSADAGRSVLILIEELEQFTRLIPYLKHSYRFAHGGTSKENRDKVPKDFHESDPSLLVKQFNNEEFPILIGTSCITTGTDLKANEVTIYLQGGKSEIQVMQGPCGRSTRLFTFKDGRKKRDCTVVDFDVQNDPTCHRHLLERKVIYQSCGPVKEIL